MFANFKQISGKAVQYFPNYDGEKIKVEFVSITTNDLSDVINSGIDYSFKFNKYELEPDNEDIICKCSFIWEHLTSKILNKYIIDEMPIYKAKKWFLSKLDLFQNLVIRASSTEDSQTYVDAYLRAVADLELNSIIILEDGTQIYCLGITPNISQN